MYWKVNRGNLPKIKSTSLPSRRLCSTLSAQWWQRQDAPLPCNIQPLQQPKVMAHTSQVEASVMNPFQSDDTCYGLHCSNFKPLRCIQTIMRIMLTAQRNWNWTQMPFTYGIDSRSLLLSDTRQNNSTVSTLPFIRHSILTFEIYAEMVHDSMKVTLTSTPSINVVSTLPLYFSHVDFLSLWPGIHAAIVWSTDKQMAIVDSLAHNYYMPPVVFAIFMDPVDMRRNFVSIGSSAWQHTKVLWWTGMPRHSPCGPIPHAPSHAQP